MPILADYFMSVTVPPEEENIGVSNPPIVIVDRYPVEDHKKHRFPENSQYCCIPGDAKIKYVKTEKRRPYFFTFCFTLDDHSRSYGTSLFYYEKLKINGEYRMDKKGRQLYVPRALCVLSHQPMFSVFNVFLRELYRNAILESEDSFAEDSSSLPRVDSFDALLRKGSICDTLDDNFFTSLPLERHIRHFIDYCPSLDPALKITIPIFQKMITVCIPPFCCLPYADKLCFECLFTSLSPKNIARLVALTLQENRILLVSEQADSLTLCAQALTSLLYPFRWYHPFIPILPLSVTETISAEFPYIFGVTTHQYKSDDCQSNLDGVVVVHLDFDKIIIPKSVTSLEFRKSFIRKLTKRIESQIPPPATRVLYCNNTNISESSFIVFEVVFGPGRLGIKIKSKKVKLYATKDEVECAYVSHVHDEDMTLTGPGRRVALLRREPYIVAINRRSVVGKHYKDVKSTIEDAPRPLIVRFQIGQAPAEVSSLLASPPALRTVPRERNVTNSILTQSCVFSSPEDMEVFSAKIAEIDKIESSENKDLVKKNGVKKPLSLLNIPETVPTTPDVSDLRDLSDLSGLSGLSGPGLSGSNLSGSSGSGSSGSSSPSDHHNLSNRHNLSDPSDPSDIQNSNSSLTTSPIETLSQKTIPEVETSLPIINEDSIHLPLSSDIDSSLFTTPKTDENELPSIYPFSPVLQTPTEEELKHVHRYYNYITPLSTEESTKQSDEKMESKMEKYDFIESIRITFMLELCRLIGHYKKYFRRIYTSLYDRIGDDAGDNAEMKDILDKHAFLRACDDDDRAFVKKLTHTQLFRHFIEDAYEYEDNYEINLFNDCNILLDKMKDYAEMYIYDQLLPSKWKLDEVQVDLPTDSDLPEGWYEDELTRDYECFPRLKTELYGGYLARMKPFVEKNRKKSILPENIKETLASYQEKNH